MRRKTVLKTSLGAIVLFVMLLVAAGCPSSPSKVAVPDVVDQAQASTEAAIAASQFDHGARHERRIGPDWTAPAGGES